MGSIFGRLFARLLFWLVFLLIVRPLAALWLVGKRAYRSKREGAWPTSMGTIESAEVINGQTPRYSTSPYTWTVAVTVSYCYNGEYYSMGERRVFFTPEATNRFYAVVRPQDSHRTLDTPRAQVRVAVNPQRPDKAMVVGFFEDADTLAQNVLATAVAAAQ